MLFLTSFRRQQTKHLSSLLFSVVIVSSSMELTECDGKKWTESWKRLFSTTL